MRERERMWLCVKRDLVWRASLLRPNLVDAARFAGLDRKYIKSCISNQRRVAVAAAAALRQLLDSIIGMRQKNK